MGTQTADVDGRELARRYHRDVVGPLLHAAWPGLPHAVGLLGPGSEVLGLDDAMSRDHDWGPRLTLLVDEDHVEQVDTHLEAALPQAFCGRPTRFATTADPTARHRVTVDTAPGFATARLGFRPQDLSVSQWLSLTGQSVLEVTAGPVFVDTAGEITGIRRRLDWYPDDVWRYVVAADWARIGQELPLLGRAGERGDDVGSQVIAGRLVRAALHLGFLLERRWPPYPKWLGLQFAGLPRANAALPALADALGAARWPQRQDALGGALTQLIQLQTDVGLGGGGEAVEPFHDRPFLGVRADVVPALLGAVTDPDVRRLPVGVGSVEQCVDNVDVLGSPRRRLAMMVDLG